MTNSRVDDRKGKPSIDPDFGPRNPHNVEVARRLRWKYDRRRRVYRDYEGEMIADRFGQPLG